MSKFEPLRPSRSGDISHLVFKISKEAVKQPCLDQKIQRLFSKYSYFLCIFWHKIFRAFSYIPKCYFKIVKRGTWKIGQKRWLCAFNNSYKNVYWTVFRGQQDFDTINHELLIAKLYAYGFDKNALTLVLNYLSNRWQRTKINGSFSSWSELMQCVPQGSVLGPLLFNIYLNDLFYQFIETEVCTFADDTTSYACDTNLKNLIQRLEIDSLSAILWFENNYMKLNEGCLENMGYPNWGTSLGYHNY